MKTSIASRRVVLSLCTAVTSISLLATTNSAQAVTVQFNDLASFTGATTTQNIDFEGLAIPGSSGVYYPAPVGLTTSGVAFNSANNNLIVIDPTGNNNFTTAYNWGSGSILLGNANDTITAILPSGVTAVGSDIMSFSNYASPFTINLSTGETFNVNSLNYPNRQFIGFISDTAIASISFQANGGITELDNFRFGTANAAASVPEPFTVIGTLVGGTAALRMRKKLKSAQK